MMGSGGSLWFRVRMLWLANTSNLILNFTYLKAAFLALWRAILCKNLEFKATGEVATPGKKSRTCHFCSFQWWSIRSVAQPAANPTCLHVKRAEASGIWA